jgi:hypothetical protein
MLTRLARQPGVLAALWAIVVCVVCSCVGAKSTANDKHEHELSSMIAVPDELLVSSPKDGEYLIGKWMPTGRTVEVRTVVTKGERGEPYLVLDGQRLVETQEPPPQCVEDSIKKISALDDTQKMSTRQSSYLPESRAGERSTTFKDNPAGAPRAYAALNSFSTFSRTFGYAGGCSGARSFYIGRDCSGPAGRKHCYYFLLAKLPSGWTHCGGYFAAY